MMQFEDNNTIMKQSVSKDQFSMPKVNAKKPKLSQEEKDRYRALCEQRVELFNSMLRKQMRIRNENKLNRKTYKSALWYNASHIIIDC